MYAKGNGLLSQYFFIQPVRGWFIFHISYTGKNGMSGENRGPNIVLPKMSIQRNVKASPLVYRGQGDLGTKGPEPLLGVYDLGLLSQFTNDNNFKTRIDAAVSRLVSRLEIIMGNGSPFVPCRLLGKESLILRG
jgi:hypothetical protein